MHGLPADWSALCAVVLMLGMRHGVDADHLAAIDGMTRLSARRGKSHARYCGALFSLGHGVVVMAIAAFVGSLSQRWTPPEWLDAFGAWTSIVFLVLVGVVNLRAVLVAAPGSVVAASGVRSSLFGRLLRAESALGVLAVGALFAVSVDTISQSALFAMTATRFGGLTSALCLGALFVLGMVLVDGINGWWIARLMARADRVAVVTSRAMGLAVGSLSLLVAALGAARLLSPSFDSWSDARGPLFGAVVVAVVVLSYLAGRWIAGDQKFAVSVNLKLRGSTGWKWMSLTPPAGSPGRRDA